MGVFLQDLGLDSINSPYQSFTLDLFESEVEISQATAIKNIIGGIFYIYTDPGFPVYSRGRHSGGPTRPDYFHPGSG